MMMMMMVLMIIESLQKTITLISCAIRAPNGVCGDLSIIFCASGGNADQHRVTYHQTG
jgi:hypothetical protein